MRTPLALTLLAALLSVCVPALVRGGSLNGWPQTPSAVRYRTDAVVVRLAAGGGSGSGAAFDRGTAVLERAAQDLAGVRFEREFPPVAAFAPFRGAERARAAAARLDERGFERFWIAHLPRDLSVERAIDVLGSAPGIESAERIAIVPVLATPNDSLWSKAYYFFQASRRDISAREAWDLTTGDTSIVVAILDTGVLMDHPDLTGGVPWGGNMYTNWAEQGGQPGVDDDGNGYVDDVHGWDFIALDDSAQAQPSEDWRDEDNDPNDFVGHGTAVAGLVGAITDNHIGVAGTSWHVRLMPLRVGWSSSRAASGEIDLSSVARAFHYCAVMGVDVMNCSFASVSQGDLEFALTEATNAGVLTIFSAGNNGSPAYLALRQDVMSVAATDADDKIAMFSSRGDFVDIAAPGVFVSTTSLNKIFGADSAALRQPDYATSASGTSFSAPIVAGAAALLQAQRVQRGLRRMAPLDIQLRLMDTADDISAQNPGVIGYGRGRLNLVAALTAPLTSFAVPGKWKQVGAAVVVTAASGHKRVYYATADSSVLVTDAEGGAILSRIRLPARPSGGLAAADMGGGLGVAMFVPLVDGRIYGFDVGGRALAGWPVAATPTSTTEAPTAALGDLDGDGRLEVVWGGTDGAVWAWNADGTRRSGFPRFVGAALDNVRVALCDLDAAPGAEIVTSSPSGSIYVITGAGRSLPYWPRNLDPYPTPPIVMHVAGTTDPIIVVASMNAIYAFKADASLWRAKVLPGAAGGSIATGDLDGDGRDEIVVPTSPNQISVLDDAFNPLATFAPVGTVQRGSLLPAPVIGPLGGATPSIGFGMGAGFDAFTPTGTHLTNYPKPDIGSGLWPTLDEIDGDGRTEILAGSGRDAAIYTFDAGAATWRTNASPWPTVRANFARTGTRLYSPSLAAVDDEAPFGVVDLGVTATMPYQVGLQWTAPADRGGSGLEYFDVRYAKTPETLTDFGSAPHLGDVPSSVDPGAVQSTMLSGLEEDRTYYLAMRAVDRDGNHSTTSNIVTVATPPGFPDAISDLGIYGQTDSTVSLRWTATGDDGRHGRPLRYRLRAAEAPLTPDTFDQAPIALDTPARQDPGTPEVATLAGLERGARYWIAIEAEDDRGHRSGISNVIETRVGTLPQRGFALALTRVPSAPPIELQWLTGNSSAQAARLDIHDVGGRRVRRFQLATGSEGIVDWDGRDERGESLPPGLYFARLSDGQHHAEARIVMVK